MWNGALCALRRTSSPAHSKLPARGCFVLALVNGSLNK